MLESMLNRTSTKMGVAGTFNAEDFAKGLLGSKFGPYQIIRLEAPTKYGGVFEAFDKLLNRRVALKILSPNSPSEEITRFRNEGERLAAVSNDTCPKSIVHIYTAGTIGRAPYLVMEWVEGKNLSADKDNFTPVRTSHMMHQIGQAIAYCHSYDIHHEDLKLANIRIRSPSFEEESFALIDFGGRRNKRDDLRALGDIAKSLVTEQTVPETLERIIEDCRSGNYVAHRLVEDLEDYHKGIDIHGRRITRRRILALGAGAAALAATIGIPSAIQSYYGSPDRLIEKLANMDLEDPRFDQCALDLQRKLFERKIKKVAETIPASKFPFGTNQKGDWYVSADRVYSNGFWPGILWEGYRQTSDPHFRDLAEQWTNAIALSPEDQENTTATRFFHSHAKAYDLTGKTSHSTHALKALGLLASRFDPRLGYVPPFPSKPLVSEASTMYNIVPFLLWSGSEQNALIAREHVQTLTRDHLKENGAVRKTVLRDASTLVAAEEMNSKSADYSGSTFARSQAQMLYGLVAYSKITQDRSLLKRAEDVANYFIGQSSPTLIPYADLDAVHTSTSPVDTSAAAIAITSLRELHSLTKKNRFLDASRQIKKSLVRGNYICTGLPEQGVLKGACENPRKDSYVGTSLIYGDYFYLSS